MREKLVAMIMLYWTVNATVVTTSRVLNLDSVKKLVCVSACMHECVHA